MGLGKQNLGEYSRISSDPGELGHLGYHLILPQLILLRMVGFGLCRLFVLIKRHEY